MRIQTFIAAVAAVGFITSSAVAAVLPAPAHLTVAPSSSVAGARIGSMATGKRSNFAGGGAGMVIAGVAAIGIGVAIADAAGAFKDKDHRPAVSP